MFEELMDKASGLMENENVKGVVEKATEFINTDKGKEIIETVKEKASEIIGSDKGQDIIEKAEEFIKEKFSK